jgi:hypothetical protein
MSTVTAISFKPKATRKGLKKEILSDDFKKRKIFWKNIAENFPCGKIFHLTSLHVGRSAQLRGALQSPRILQHSFHTLRKKIVSERGTFLTHAQVSIGGVDLSILAYIAAFKNVLQLI